jgi:glycosyltransferase involved in cell wall biosynthesis
MAIYTEIADWLTYSIKVAAEVTVQHRRAPLDLVDFPEWGCEGYVHLLNRTEWNWIPTVIHLHGPLVMFAHTMGWPDKESEFYRVGMHMERTCLRLGDAVFSSSDCSADWCAKHYGLQRAKIPRLHTGIDTEWFYPRPVSKENRPTIVFVGKIVRNKGVEILLEAACVLAREYPNLQLRMLGRGESGIIQELQGKAAAVGLEHLLDLVGFVDRQDLPSYLSRAHIFAAPSKYEGGPGFVYLEAMACGLPVIACEGSGAAEIVLPGKNGFLIPPDNVDALVKVIRRLLSNPQACQEIGAFGRRYVLAEAESTMCLKRLEAFYTAVASGSGACCVLR